jgi:hypothetical protein
MVLSQDLFTGPTRREYVETLLLVQNAVYFFPGVPVVIYLVVFLALCDRALRRSEGLPSLFLGWVLFLGAFDELSQGVGGQVFIQLLLPGCRGEGLPQGVISAAIDAREHGHDPCVGLLLT